MGTYAPAAIAAFVALALVLALLVAPLRSHLLQKRRRRRSKAVEQLSPERRARLEQF